MTELRQHTDGIDGFDLGVHGESQYALTTTEQVYRRKASEFGTSRDMCAKGRGRRQRERQANDRR